MITKITDQMPSPEEVERVKSHLEIRGWPPWRAAISHNLVPSTQ